MSPSAVERATAELPVIAIVREFASEQRALDVVSALIDGGVTALEVTTNTLGWQRAVELARTEGVVAVGVGTVVTVEQVAQAHECGATFVVSPGTDPVIIGHAISLDVEPLPGALTPTEIGSALRSGARRVKLFPAGVLGLPYFAALRAPFDAVDFIPTGGLAPRSAVAWLDAGAWALGVGGSLTAGSPEEIRKTMCGLRETVLANWKGRS
jgi:2-dehydro-3-deoxyphosphogluconate aldolase/(4S)-4-hydroxy-2-oxoglutarate aldolase